MIPALTAMLEGARPVAPTRPLTPAQAAVVVRLGAGEDYDAIADHIGCSVDTVRTHIKAVAMLLPNPDNLPAGKLVMLWAAQARWHALLAMDAERIFSALAGMGIPMSDTG